MKITRPVLILVVAVIIVIVAGVAVAVFLVARRGLPAAEAPKPIAVYAPKGEIASGFPKELILDSASAPEESYEITYPQSGPVQRTTDFTSSKPMADLFSEYKNYFSKNGWTITNEVTKYPTSRGLYAKKDTAVASVSVISRGQTSYVTVTYLAGK